MTAEEAQEILSKEFADACDKRDLLAIYRTIACGYVGTPDDVLELLKEDQDGSGCELLERSCAELLLLNGVRLHDGDASTGMTLLHRAAQNGMTGAVSYLLRKGADHRAVDLQGRKPIDVCPDTPDGAECERLIKEASMPMESARLAPAPSLQQFMQPSSAAQLLFPSRKKGSRPNSQVGSNA
jgi:ankyrin repeat protein